MRSVIPVNRVVAVRAQLLRALRARHKCRWLQSCWAHRQSKMYARSRSVRKDNFRCTTSLHTILCAALVNYNRSYEEWVSLSQRACHSVVRVFLYLHRPPLEDKRGTAGLFRDFKKTAID